jgi:4-carboxymuconolactone decarboxylase
VTERSPGCRFEPLSVHDLSGEQRLLAENILKFSLNGLNGPFNMMLRSPEPAEILLSLGNYMRFRTTIPPRLVEFAVLLHARIWTDQYEWDMHVDRAVTLGLAPDVVQDVKAGRRPPMMSVDEGAIFDYCVELIKTRAVRDSTYTKTRELLGERGLTDLTILLGQYGILSMILSVSQAGAGRNSLPAVPDPFPAPKLTDIAPPASHP